MDVARKILLRYPKASQRFLEILPGFFSWFMILFPVWGSLVIPYIVAYYIIAFDIYWLYRSITLATLSIGAYFKITAAQKFDWLAEVNALSRSKADEIHHIVIIPTYKEPLSTLERTLDNLLKQTYALKRIHIMLSFEEREGAPAKEKASELVKKYAKHFGHLWTTYHPDIQGEVKGKSSNTAWGAKRAKELLVDQEKLDIHKITITSEDADALLHPQYFAAITSEFLRAEKPFNLIWQPAIMFYNNIWRVPAPIRVMASVFSINQIFILMRKDRLVNFSTYTISLKMVHDIGYWDTDVIPEDYRMFFKAYFALDGKVDVHPVFLPVYADAAESTNFWGSMQNQYEQIKRWAWGVSDDAYIIKSWIMAEKTPFWDKTIRVLKTLEDHFLWPVNWFVITIGAMLPPLLNEEFNRTILGKTLPQVSSAILTICLLSLLVVFVIDARLRPPRPYKVNFLARLMQPLEFILLPVIGFFFSALPGVDAHTRLMLGKYIEYRVTEKV